MIKNINTAIQQPLY